VHWTASGLPTKNLLTASGIIVILLIAFISALRPISYFHTILENKKENRYNNIEIISYIRWMLSPYYQSKATNMILNSRVKYVLAISITGLSALIAKSNPVVAAATTFYASILFFDRMVKYPALYVKDFRIITMHNSTEDISGFKGGAVPVCPIRSTLTIKNTTNADVKDLTLYFRVHDPIRNISSIRIQKQMDESNIKYGPKEIPPSGEIILDPKIDPDEGDLRNRLNGKLTRGCYLEIFLSSDHSPKLELGTEKSRYIRIAN
jgi:hypothetical protein